MGWFFLDFCRILPRRPLTSFILFLWVTFLDFFNILLRRSSPSFNLFLWVDFFLEFWRILLSRPSTSFKLFLWVKFLDFLTLRWEGLQPVLSCFCGLISGCFFSFSLRKSVTSFELFLLVDFFWISFSILLRRSSTPAESTSQWPTWSSTWAPTPAQHWQPLTTRNRWRWSFIKKKGERV